MEGRCRTCLKIYYWNNYCEKRFSILSKVSSPTEVSKFLYCFANIKNEINLELYKNVCDLCLEKAVDTILFHNQCLWANKVLPIVSTQSLEDREFDKILNKNFLEFINSSLKWNQDLQCLICFKNYESLELLKKHTCEDEVNIQNENVCNTNNNEQLQNSTCFLPSEECVIKILPSNISPPSLPDNIENDVQPKPEESKLITVLNVEKINEIVSDIEFGLNPYVPKLLCSICGKAFIKRCRLKEHEMKTHQRDLTKNTHECPKCKQVVAHLNHLREHMKTHEEKNGESKPPTEKKRQLCSICGASFSTSSNLAVHLRRHNGKMTCSCIICGKGFPRKTDLTLHMRKHTGEKPYGCQICTKRFSRSDKLTIHMRSHTGEKPYVCICGCSYKQSNDLNNHKRKKKCGQKLQQKSSVSKEKEQSEPTDANSENLFSIKIIENPEVILQNDENIDVTADDNEILQVMERNVVKNEFSLNMPWI